LVVVLAKEPARDGVKGWSAFEVTEDMLLW
jgi:hypothetical protein